MYDIYANVLKKYFDFSSGSNKLIIERHLVTSYLMTWISTGIPGIKWNLGKTGENKFAYMVTRDKKNALIFQGGSMYRGS